MKYASFLKTAAVLTAACAALSGQTPQNTGILYQQAGVIGMHAGGNVTTMSIPAMGPGLFTPETVTGSPFAATHQTHSLQVLGDGTRIEQTQSQQVYRDSTGRTRVENGAPGTGTIMIQDPASGTMTILDPAAKTARKMPGPRLLSSSVVKTSASQTSSASGPTTFRMQTGIAVSPAGGPGEAVTIMKGMALAPSIVVGQAVSSSAIPDASGAVSTSAVEDLPAQNVHGVLATGRRTTITIPAGAIGNDRPLQVVNETWYSSDLQMVVKSSNSDPRFGDTTSEYTGINRNEPDPGLFQVPADYTQTEIKPMQLKDAQP